MSRVVDTACKNNTSDLPDEEEISRLGVICDFSFSFDFFPFFPTITVFSLFSCIWSVFFSTIYRKPGAGVIVTYGVRLAKSDLCSTG